MRVRKKQGYTDMGRVQMVVGGGYLDGLSRAAALRGLTPTAYMRRAVAAFIAADTGTDIHVFLRDSPHPDGPGYGTFDDGAGHGDWVASRFTDDTGVI